MFEHGEQLRRRAQTQAFQSLERAHGSIARYETRRGAALYGEHGKAMQLAAELRLGGDEASIERGLFGVSVESGVKAGLSPLQMCAAACVDRRDQSDVRDAVAQLDERVLRRQERSRPVRLNSQPPAGFSLDPLHPLDIRAAERMTGPVGARIREHGAGLLRFRGAASEAHDRDRCEQTPQSKPPARRKSATCSTMRSWLQSAASTMSAESISVGTPAASSASRVRFVPD